MEKARQKILFISHEATRSGAPILLLNLAKLIREKANDKFSVSFLIKQQPYTILEDFLSYPTAIAAKKEYSVQWFMHKLSSKISFLQSIAGAKFSENNIKKALEGVDVVVSNTITNMDILPLVKKYFNGPVISYIHELKTTSSKYTATKESIDILLGCSTRFMVPSMAVKDFLVETYHVAPEKIDLLNYYIPGFSVNKTAIEPENKTSFIVGGAGIVDFRKGTDLFIQVASILFKKEPGANIKFLWKGAIMEKGEMHILQCDIDNLDLKNKVELQPAGSGMDVFFNALDVFLLTSREDPYPLVVLEAAASNVPVVCFEQAGGAPEFVQRSGGGVCVPYLDVEKMADAVLHYYKNEAQRTTAGNHAKHEMERTHQNGDLILSDFESVINKAGR